MNIQKYYNYYILYIFFNISSDYFMLDVIEHLQLIQLEIGKLSFAYPAYGYLIYQGR